MAENVTTDRKGTVRPTAGDQQPGNRGSTNNAGQFVPVSTKGIHNSSLERKKESIMSPGPRGLGTRGKLGGTISTSKSIGKQRSGGKSQKSIGRNRRAKGRK